MEDVMMTAAAPKKRVRGERQRLQDVQWRQRKKQERQHLGETAQQLETQLNQLQQDKGRLSASTPSICKSKDNRNEVKWQERAEKMKQKRFEAELLKLTLRRAVTCELRVAKSLRTAMHKRPHMTPKVVAHVHRGGCPETVATQVQHSPCLQCCNPTTLHINPTAVRREIEATLLRMHQQAVDVLNSSAANDSLSFHCNVRLDPDAGPTTEVSVTTPVNCAVKDAVKLLGPKFHARSHGDATGPRCIPEPRRTGGLPNE